MLSEKQAVELLKKHSSSEKSFANVLRHSQAVKSLALKIAGRQTGKKIDKQLLRTAALLHDIGRFKCPPWKNSAFHGLEGARILRKEKLPRHARVAETHLGSGITKREAKKLGLPAKNYLPRTIEEKIICHADSLIAGSKVSQIRAVISRYKRYGKPSVKRALKLHKMLKLEKFIK